MHWLETESAAAQQISRTRAEAEAMLEISDFTHRLEPPSGS